MATKELAKSEPKVDNQAAVTHIKVPLASAVTWDADYILEDLTTGLDALADLLLELAGGTSVDNVTGNALYGVRQLVKYYTAMADTARELALASDKEVAQ